MKEEDVKKLIDKLQYFDYDKLLNKIRKNVKKPSVLVTGGTGVGKSSLINHLFGMDVAKTGNGKPMTDRITRYEPENYDVVLYDTLGYEVGEDKQQQFYKDVIGFVKKANGQSDIKKHVHLAWYCISAANKRVTPTDLDAIAALDGLTEVCVVLTQIDAATMVELDEMKQVLQKKLPKTSVFLVSIDPRETAEDFGVPGEHRSPGAGRKDAVERTAGVVGGSSGCRAAAGICPGPGAGTACEACPGG